MRLFSRFRKGFEKALWMFRPWIYIRNKNAETNGKVQKYTYMEMSSYWHYGIIDQSNCDKKSLPEVYIFLVGGGGWFNFTG